MAVDLASVLPQIEELCRRYGLTELSVFGSVAHGQERSDSDIDLLYVRGPNSRAGLQFLRLKDELEQLLGRSVDLVPKDYLHWIIRDRVLDDAQVLYAA